MYFETTHTIIFESSSFQFLLIFRFLNILKADKIYTFLFAFKPNF